MESYINSMVLNPLESASNSRITMKFANAVCVIIGSLIPLVSSVVVPGASTPLFYLVSSSSSGPANQLVRVFYILKLPDIY